MNTEAAVIAGTVAENALLLVAVVLGWSLFYVRGWRITCPPAKKATPPAAEASAEPAPAPVPISEGRPGRAA